MSQTGNIKLLWISELNGEQFGLLAEAAVIFGLKDLGVDITVLCRPGSRFVPEFRKKKIPFHEKHPTSKWDRKETGRLRKFILEGGFNIIQLFNNKAIIQTLRATKGLDTTLLSYRGFAGHIHWYDPTSYLTHLHPRIDGIWCISKVVKRFLDKQFIWRKPRMRVIYKGQDPSWYEDIQAIGKEAIGLEPNSFAVVMVANYRKYKGVDDFVSALRFIPEDLPIHFVLIGRGMDGIGLVKKIESLPGSERLHILGFRKDVLQVVASCDLAVNVSWTEALSKTLFEATFLGLPCLTTAVSGNLELIPGEEFGWQVPVRDPRAISRAIQDAYLNPAERSRKALNARSFVGKNFNTKTTAKELLQWYKEFV